VSDQESNGAWGVINKLEEEIASLRAENSDLKAKLSLAELALSNATCTLPDTYSSAGVEFYSERDALRETLKGEL
jgi:hypothetical protein